MPQRLIKHLYNASQNHLTYYQELVIRKITHNHLVKQVQEERRYLRKPEKPFKIVFICQAVSVWNSMKSIYESACLDDRVDAYILAVPESKGTKDFEENTFFSEINSAFDFCTNNGYRAIKAFTNERWFDLKEFSPDIVFFPRPYDQYLPKRYRSEEIRRYSYTAYIPYAYCKMNWDSRKVYKYEFIRNMDYIFTENAYYENMINNISETFFDSRINVRYLGFPRFDNAKLLRTDTSGIKKTFLWLPRWTTSKEVEASTFFIYKDYLIDYFSSHRDVKLICRPHPLMMNNFLSTGEISESDYDSFMNAFKILDNLEYDESPDYMDSFCNADVFLSDTSSLLIEEIISGKPIVYFGNTNKFDKEARKWSKIMYCCNDVNQLKNILSQLIRDSDPLRQKRYQYMQNSFKNENKCGESILSNIISNFEEKI